MKAIEKIKNQPAQILFLFFLLLGVAGCSKERTVNGQVFIVTRDAQNIKLGLAEILLIDEKSANNWASQMQSGAGNESSTVKVEMDEAQKKWEEARDECDAYTATNITHDPLVLKIKKAQEELSEKLVLVDTELAAIRNKTQEFSVWLQNEPKRIEAYRLANPMSNTVPTADTLKLNEYEDFIKVAKVKAPQLLDDKKFLEGERERFQSLLDSTQQIHETERAAIQKVADALQSQFYKSKLRFVNECFTKRFPTFFAKTLSDADGKFTLKCSEKGRIAILCRASRQVGPDEERYVWFCWLPAKHEGELFLLSNNNLASENYSNNVLTVVSK